MIGIFSWYGFVLPFEERIAQIRAAGFEATTLWWEDEGPPYPVKKSDMPRLVREAGLCLENLHAPFNDSDALWSEDEGARQAVVCQHLDWLLDCAKHQVPVLVMHQNNRPGSVASRAQGLKSFETLVRFAEDHGVRIALENTRHNERLRWILEMVPSEALGLCFDSSHHLLTDPGHFQLLEDFGHRLLATHLSDNDGIHDRHWLPGHGVLDWSKVSRAFPGTYDGPLTLEVCPTENEWEAAPQDFLKLAYQRISAVKAQIVTKDHQSHSKKRGLEEVMK